VAICGAASVLIAPVSWVHHGVWLSVAVMALVGRAIRARDARVLVVAAAVFVASVSYFCRLGDWWINRHDWSLAPALIREWFFFMGVGIVLLLPYGPSRRTRAERAEEARHSDTPSVSGRLVTVGGAR